MAMQEGMPTFCLMKGSSAHLCLYSWLLNCESHQLLQHKLHCPHLELIQTMDVATVQIETGLIPISVMIVPTISTPIHNSCHPPLDTLPQLKGLKLTNPITHSQEFTISILIGTDYYWSFEQDRIIRGAGPTAQLSKLGYLVSSPVPHLTYQLSA